jgi:hypothetical protein
MGRRVAWALLLMLCVPAIGSGHEPSVLDQRRATPGITIELVPLPPSQRTGAAQYRLRATGVPRNVTFDVLAKDFRHEYREVASGFRVDAAGTLVSTETDGGRPQRLDDLALGPGQYPRGARWDVALASHDRTVTAFTHVIPHPIAARDGTCVISLELVSPRGERFLASGTGFAPGDDVLIASRSAGRASQRRRRATGAGTLALEVITHAPSESDRRARYSVKGRSCEVTIDYEWGPPALQPR